MKSGDIPDEKIVTRTYTGGFKTKYRPEYCHLLIEHMGEGLSFESFAGRVGIARRTLYKWRQTIPEFKDAYDVGTEKALLYWEKLLIEGATGEVKANANLMIFKLKNSFGDLYTDRKEIEMKNVQPTQIIFRTGITRPGDADHILEDMRKEGAIETVDFTEIIANESEETDNGEDLL